MCVIPSLDTGKRSAGSGVPRHRHPFCYLDISNNADAGVPVPPALCMGVGELAGGFVHVILCICLLFVHDQMCVSVRVYSLCAPAYMFIRIYKYDTNMNIQIHLYI